MYMYGGRQDGYPCDLASTNVHRRGLWDTDPSISTTAFCRHDVGATSELWRLDPRTVAWALLDTIGTPPPRERHTAVVLVNNPGSFHKGKMVVYGGHSGGGEIVKDGGPGGEFYLGDVWVMDPGAFSKHKLVGTGGGKKIKDTRNLFVTTRFEIAPDLCIADANVRIRIRHNCTRDLKIRILGPGHPWRGTMHRESMSKFHDDGITSDESAFAEDPPLARDAPVLLFDRHDGTRSQECGVDIGNTLFDDQSDRSIDEDYLSPFQDIAVRPLERLDRYNGLQAAGDWTLHIYDETRNTLEGYLESWEIDFELRACRSRYEWSELQPTGSPPTRFGHSALVVEGKMYM